MTLCKQSVEAEDERFLGVSDFFMSLLVNVVYK